jgi:regulator of sigma E protease
VTIDGILFWLGAIPATLLVLTILVLVHEIGHFATARLAGIRVLEFGIGFPPRARVLHDDGETIYSLNYLPIGGFVRMEGEDADSNDPRSFANAPILRQIGVLVAGVTMNLIVAFVLFFIVALLFSPGEAVRADYIVPNSAAAAAGLRNGVTIESINGQRFGFMTSQDLLSAIQAHPGQTVEIGYVDLDGARKTVQVTLGSRLAQGSNGPTGVLGITCQPVPVSEVIGARDALSRALVALGSQPLPAAQPCGLKESVTYSSTDPATAIAMAADQTGKSLQLILQGLGRLGEQLATHPEQAPANVAGPVGITQVVGIYLFDFGPVLVILLAAVLSANLALVNILPIPPFDGGKVAIVLIKRAFGVRGVGAYEIATNVIGFVLLMAFLAWISYFDILRIGGGG